jgi:outer membrane lipoprotein-sorting protein
MTWNDGQVKNEFDLNNYTVNYEVSKSYFVWKKPPKLA